MKKILSFGMFLPIFFLTACITETVYQPVPQTESVVSESIPEKEIEPEVMQEPAIKQETAKPDETDAIVAQFDTVTITKQTFEITKTEMQLVVEKLNKITYERDYDSWLGWLSDEYYRTYSDPVMLETLSAGLPIKGFKLKNLRDYFDYVFVPSRQNMRVDDIMFVSPTRVYVIMEITPKSPAAIYILEKMGAEWKLVPKIQ